MKSFDFPNMIKTNSAAILQDKKATENNFKLLLSIQLSKNISY